MSPDLDIQIFKCFIRSNLEYGSIIWEHTICTTIYQRFLQLLKMEHWFDDMLILRALKSTFLEAMGAELCIAAIDLRLHELQGTETIKRF